MTDFTIGTTATGTTTADGNDLCKTLIQTGRSEADQYFVGMLLKITSGACSGQKRIVTGWLQTIGTFTVTPAFSAKIASGVTYAFMSVVLPQYPHKFQEKNPTDSKARALPGNNYPLIITPGRNPRTVDLEAYLYYPGYSNATILSNYVAPLREMTHTVVLITSADAFYDGSYILDYFNPDPQAPGVVKIAIRLMMGGQMQVY